MDFSGEAELRMRYVYPKRRWEAPGRLLRPLFVPRENSGRGQGGQRQPDLPSGAGQPRAHTRCGRESALQTQKQSEFHTHSTNLQTTTAFRSHAPRVH